MAFVISEDKIEVQERVEGLVWNPANPSKLPSRTNQIQPGERRVHITNDTDQTLYMFDMAGNLLQTIKGTGRSDVNPLACPIIVSVETGEFVRRIKDREMVGEEWRTRVISKRVFLHPNTHPLFSSHSEPIHIPTLGIIIADEGSKNRVMTISQIKDALQSSATSDFILRHWRIEYDPTHPTFDKYRNWKKVPFFLEMKGEVITLAGTPVVGLGSSVKIYTRIRHTLSPMEDESPLEHVFTMDNIDVRDRGMMFSVKSDLGVNKYHISNDYAMILERQKESISHLTALEEKGEWKEKYETLKEESDTLISRLKEEITLNEEDHKRTVNRLKDELKNEKNIHKLREAEWEAELENEKRKVEDERRKHGFWHRVLDMSIKVVNVAVGVATIVGKLFLRRI